VAPKSFRWFYWQSATTIFLLSFSFVISIESFSQKVAWPDYPTVVDSFFNNYDFPCDERYVRFEKRKEGWYVAEVLYSDADNAVLKSLYWSAANGKYINLPYKNTPGDSADLAYWRGYFNRNSMDQFSLYQYERNRYYGYNGWNWDVISDAGELETLSDTALESLARAYAGYATGYFSNQFGFHFINNDTDRAIIKQNVAISKSRTAKFDYYQRKALECYDLLAKKHPDYTTNIGDIVTKVANETFTGYFQLSLAGDPVRAQFYLNKCQFPDSVLTKARTFLEDSPPNSILFVSGDSHTYGIWYLQAKDGFRNDVKAINFDLLALPRYVKFIDDSNAKSFFTTSPSMYMNDTMLILLQDEKDSENILESKQFFQQIRFPDKEFLSENPNSPYARYPGTAIVFPCRHKGGDGRGEKKLSVPLKRYIFLNDFLLFDIIHTHCKNRKIGFTYLNNDLLDLVTEYKSLFLLGDE
jgi:hypothetical protein